MKRIVITSIAAIILAFSASAQDTIHHNGPLPNYYFPYAWIFDFDTLTCSGLGCGENTTDAAAGYITNDTLNIYGIAAMLIPDTGDGWGEFYMDTTIDKLTEYLRLYFPSDDTLVRHAEQLPVNMKNTPVSYYLLIEKVSYPGWPYGPPDSLPPLPVYERYFSSPVQVSDTFFVGRSNETYRRTSDPDHPFSGWGVKVITFRGGTRYDPQQKHLTAFREEGSGWHIQTIQQDHRFLCPILTPPDTTVVAGDTIAMGDTIIVCDTIIIGSDTIIQYDTILGIDDHGMLGRLTGVMPNPAAETAKVVSSFGLSRVEAYNLAGEKVDDLRLPSPSLSATLDVRLWPAGAYILRIHTPQGVATKKLTVVR